MPKFALPLSDAIDNTTGSSTWANDNSTLFYTKKDEQTLRSNEIFRHKIGDSVETDVLIFTEEDDTEVTIEGLVEHYEKVQEGRILFGEYLDNFWW